MQILFAKLYSPTNEPRNLVFVFLFFLSEQKLQFNFFSSNRAALPQDINQLLL